MLVETKDDHRWSRVGLFRSGFVGLLKRAIVGLLGRVLGGFFAPRNDEGGRSPLVRSAVLAAWSLLARRWGLFGSWLLHMNSSSRALQNVRTRDAHCRNIIVSQD